MGEIVASKYRLDRLLGSGGMAEVHAATNIQTEKRVALKWVLPALASTTEGRTRFQREALAAGRIHHPNVVTIFDVVEHQGSLCLVMELLEGETLAKRLLRGKQLPFIEAVALILPAMRGVAAAHAEGVIHRDLKPDNIFLCRGSEGEVRDCKVLDFGVSKRTSADGQEQVDITLTGNLVGTPAYMAPEQVRGSREIDQRVDVYALGVVLYQTLAGRPPFLRESYSAVMVDIATTDPPPLSQFRPDVPRRLAEVVHRALERDPDRRFGDVPSFMLALEDAARDELGIPFRTPGDGILPQVSFSRPHFDPSARTMRFRGRGPTRRWVQILVAVCFVAGGLGAWQWYARSQVVVTPLAPVAAPTPQAAAALAAPTLAPAAPPPPAIEQPAPPRPRGEKRSGGHRKKDRQMAASAREEGGPGAVPAHQRTPRAGKLSVDDF